MPLLLFWPVPNSYIYVNFMKTSRIPWRKIPLKKKLRKLRKWTNWVLINLCKKMFYYWFMYNLMIILWFTERSSCRHFWSTICCGFKTPLILPCVPLPPDLIHQYWCLFSRHYLQLLLQYPKSEQVLFEKRSMRKWNC